MPTSAINKIRLTETDSTNAELRRRAAAGAAPHGLAVSAVTQTAGRGQRGNTWEAEPGANATLSVMLRPAGVEARRQFLLSMAVSLGVTATIRALVERPEEVAVKWPNDIYIGDRKVCGILIENTLTGKLIATSIAGIGLNVNQREFRSDAPNPVSLTQVTGRVYDAESVEDALICNVLTEVEALDGALTKGDAEFVNRLQSDYMAQLWRREGMHPYIEAATGERFAARIEEVDANGTLTLEDAGGHRRRYLFKEVAFALD